MRFHFYALAAPTPPVDPVKVIFIHHSCGENWLEDTNGGLGLALESDNYYVNDTNYGWGPDSIGDATDYHNWFIDSDSSRYLSALYHESGQNSYYTRSVSEPATTPYRQGQRSKSTEQQIIP